MAVGDFFAKFIFTICGFGGSLCCMVFSIWGVIMLGLLGVFFYIEAVALIEDIPPLQAGADNAANITMSYQKAGIGCFIGAGLYVGTFFLSLSFFIFDRVKPKIM
ncbi:hypothetical protein LOD99_5081 [Oopsacas minuta]|uniref:Uncharacterized protein n=1 Tax=Oopsacas minuta TaxID=111878 RepID=A0AAV7JS06_9METZ|nr:hypothetical protein LOD99_5081 [Oopsacas minuta]